MKYEIRIAAITWLLIDIITWFINIEWAVTLAMPIGLLLLTFRDDAVIRQRKKN